MNEQDWQRTWWGLVALRLLFLLQPGYVHPDEFFQSPEVVAHEVFGFKATIPWEFTVGCRSIVPPSFISGFPFLVLRWVGVIVGWVCHMPEDLLVSSYALLVLPRLFLLVLWVVAELVIVRIARKMGHSGYAVAVVMVIAWPSLVLNNRTFSNSLESLAVVLAMGTALLDWRSPLFRNIVFGVTVAMGLFTRFTFPVFICPLGVYLLYRQLYKVHGAGFLARAWEVLIPMACSFLATSMVFTAMDMRYYGRLIATPWNSLRYNMQEENLQQHGIHPRYLHAVVNMPMMYGPLVVVAMLSLLGWLYNALVKDTHSIAASRRKTRKKRRVRQESAPVLQFVLAACVIVPLVLLSVAPHQEARFLLPLLPSLALVAAKSIFAPGRGYLLISWIAWNALGTSFFAIAHQGGLIPAVHYLHKHMHNTGGGTVIFYHTFMPPLHLLALPHHDGGTPSAWQVHDLAGASLHRLYAILDSGAVSSGKETLVVAPGTVHLGERMPRFSPLRGFWPHVTMEDPPGSLRSHELSLWLYRYERLATEAT